MFRNYLKTALRSLWKSRFYGLLNILGLAVGITCAALIFLWVQDEVTFDHHHAKRDRLYLVMNNQTYDGTTYTFASTPGGLGPALTTEVPGIARTARITWRPTNLFALGDKALYQSGDYVDPAFLQMFTFEFVKGQAAEAFRQLHSIVISEQMAQRLFGAADPMGQALKMNNAQSFTVTGVFRDQPANSSFHYDWFIPFEVFARENPWLQQWGDNGVQTYVELAPGASPAAVGQLLHGFIQSKAKDAVSTSILFPMDQWHLYNAFTNGQQDGGRIAYVRLFSLVACFILLIACINFMNLATARSEKRAREVGMRKVLGGTRAMLVAQFLGESLLLAFLAVALAVGLIYLTLPAFNTLVEKTLALDLLRPTHLLGLAGIGLLTGLLAGSYPAFYLSSFAPVAVLKGQRLPADAGAGFIRQGLVVFQFVVSIVLIIGTVVVYQQVRYVKGRQLGYDKAHLLYLSLTTDSRKHYDAIRNQLLATGVVENAGLSQGSVLGIHNNSGGYTWPGKDPNKDLLLAQETVSADYLPTIGLKLLAGRQFRTDVAADSNHIIINEAMARLIKADQVVGSALTTDEGRRLEIVGVVNDFLFNDFYKAPEPIVFFPSPTEPLRLTIRLKAGHDLPGSLARVGEVMKTANPGYPFEYKFVDQEFARAFQSEALIGQLSGLFAALAILISCLGLFGLAAYTAQRRTREIGIRKVLGASGQTIVRLLSADFLRLVAIACLLAFPLAGWALSAWLATYPYRTPLHWWVFGLAGALALLIALLTVSFQAFKASVANPVKSLRTE